MEVVGKIGNPEIIYWQKLKNNDPEAFRWIYNKYWNYLHTIAFNFTRKVEQADDLVQDVFLELWKNRNKIDETRPPLPYLRSMIRFKVISYLRRLSLRQQDAFIANVKSEIYREGVSNETKEIIAFNDLNTWLNQHLEGLPDKSRRIFELSRVENYTNQEIASCLNISVKTVEYHISKVLNQLKPHAYLLADYAFLTACAIFLFQN